MDYNFEKLLITSEAELEKVTFEENIDFSIEVGYYEHILKGNGVNLVSLGREIVDYDNFESNCDENFGDISGDVDMVVDSVIDSINDDLRTVGKRFEPNEKSIEQLKGIVADAIQREIGTVVKDLEQQEVHAWEPSTAKKKDLCLDKDM